MSTRCTSALFLSVIVACLLCRLLVEAQSRGEYDQALAEFSGGNYSSAAAKFARIDAISPGVTDALVLQSKCLVHLQDFSGAEKALRGYLELHRDSSDALYMLGFVLNRENQPADSLAVYTQAAAIAPPTSDDLKIVGLDYVLLNDNDDAIKWLVKAVAFDSRNKNAWYYLGRAYYTKARLSEARDAFESVLTLDPYDARAENNLGLIFETEGNVAGALEAYRRAIKWQEQSNEKSEQPYINLGNLLAEQGHMQEAMDPLQQAVVLAPANAYCHMVLGAYYRKIGKMADAQRELERATNLDPNSALTHYQLGRLYKDMNDIDRAKAEFARTAELQSRVAGSSPARKNQ